MLFNVQRRGSKALFCDDDHIAKTGAVLSSHERENAMTHHPLMRLMKKYDIPLTRENYLNLAYMGEVPEQLSAEKRRILPSNSRTDTLIAHQE